MKRLRALLLAPLAAAAAWRMAPLAGREDRPAQPPPPALRAALAPRAIGALGRLEPKHGVIRVAGPARPSAVVAELLVEEGDRVEMGTPLAVLDSAAADAARVTRAEAELANARAALARIQPLVRQQVLAEALSDDTRRAVAVAEANLAVARSVHALATVRAPAGGRVLAIHARSGERIGADGLLDLGCTDAMYAVAEVYETDIAAVRPGQHATVTSPALGAPLGGRVERVGLVVRSQRVLADDPAADVDARVVEVHVRLDDSARVAALSNLEVDVVIDRGTP